MRLVSPESLFAHRMSGKRTEAISPLISLRRESVILQTAVVGVFATSEASVDARSEKSNVTSEEDSANWWTSTAITFVPETRAEGEIWAVIQSSSASPAT